MWPFSPLYFGLKYYEKQPSLPQVSLLGFLFQCSNSQSLVEDCAHGSVNSTTKGFSEPSYVVKYTVKWERLWKLEDFDGSKSLGNIACTFEKSFKLLQALIAMKKWL